MAGETVITVIGNLTADPELRFTPSGAAVANFTVASTPRQFDRQSNEWKDGETLFMRCAIWRDAAENVAESLTRGSRVIVSGRLKSRSWDDKESGQKRTATELDVEEVGPSLKYATAKVNKTQRGGGGGGFGGNSGQGNSGGQGGFGGNSGQGGGNDAPANDPWATGGNSAPSGAQPGNSGQGNGGNSGNQNGQGGQGGGWNTGPSYDEPPF